MSPRRLSARVSCSIRDRSAPPFDRRQVLLRMGDGLKRCNVCFVLLLQQNQCTVVNEMRYIDRVIW